MSQGMRWPLPAGDGRLLTASKRTGTLVLQTQETEFHQRSEQIGSRFSHRAPENNVGSANTWTSVWRELHRSSDL